MAAERAVDEGYYAVDREAYPLLSDYDDKNTFDVEKYMKTRNRMRIKKSTTVDEHFEIEEVITTE